MKKLVHISVIGVLLGTLLLGGCGRTRHRIPEETFGTKKLNVVTTLFPYYDFIREIAGDEVELTMVIPAGMDSHSFEPTPADMRTIQNADILIANGGVMEQWLVQVLEAVDTSHMTVITMMDHVDTLEEAYVEGMEDDVHGRDEEDGQPGQGEQDGDDRRDDHDHDGHSAAVEYDEHIWTSPVNAMGIVELLSGILIEQDPGNRAEYEVRTTAYLENLEELHQQFLEVVKNRKRSMIILGDKFPFRYMAQEYGLQYRAAFSGCSTDTEPSAKTIAYLIDKVNEEKIPVVYYLELSSPRVSEIIGEETGAVPLLLHSCHNVTRAQFDSGITYLELMEQNVEHLRKGLVE